VVLEFSYESEVVIFHEYQLSQENRGNLAGFIYLGSIVYNSLLHLMLESVCQTSSCACSILSDVDSSLLECTIRELEKDCDTLENEANRLLMINKDLRATMQNGNSAITEEFTTASIGNEDSFAAELHTFTDDDPFERPGPEGEEFQGNATQADEPTKVSRIKPMDRDERDRPRYTLYELEEVLNEKNKFKGT